MTFDTAVINPGRLTILTALAVEDGQEFVALRKRTCLTDGNLASHARRLASAGLLEIDKCLRDGKPVTTFKLTPTGRSTLEAHVRRLMSALSHRRVGAPVPSTAPGAPTVPTTAARLRKTSPRIEDDWVD